MVNALCKTVLGATLIFSQLVAANPLVDLNARKIKTKTDTTTVPGQTPPPVITVTRTVTHKDGKPATETVVILNPSSNSDKRDVQHFEQELDRRAFQDSNAKREGGVLRNAEALEARKIKTKTDTTTVPGQTPPPVITVTRTVTKKNGKPATETVVIVNPSSNSDKRDVKHSAEELARREFQDSHAKREGGVLRNAEALEARRIKTKTDTTTVPGQTPPPVITVTRTVTHKDGKPATETVVIVNPSSNSDKRNIKRSEGVQPARREFEDADAVREGGVLRMHNH